MFATPFPLAFSIKYSSLYGPLFYLTYCFSDPNYWASYYNYYGQDPAAAQNYYATAAAYGAWGSTDATGWGAAPAFQPPPPSQPPPPPPPPEEDIPPPPPGAPSEPSLPNPKRTKTTTEETEPPVAPPPAPSALPTIIPPIIPPVIPSPTALPNMLPNNMPPPPPGTMPNLPKPSADKDKCGYYDSSTESMAWDNSWGSDTRTFAQVVSGNAANTGAADDRTGKSHAVTLYLCGAFTLECLYLIKLYLLLNT